MSGAWALKCAPLPYNQQRFALRVTLKTSASRSVPLRPLVGGGRRMHAQRRRDRCAPRAHHAAARVLRAVLHRPKRCQRARVFDLPQSEKGMNTQCSAGLLLCWLAQSAWGAEHPPASDPSNLVDLDLQALMQMDVIVTAQKREERLQNVPISVDAGPGGT